jgi:hypothetical protein
MLIALLREEEPPRLQAVLRMSEHMLKVNKDASRSTELTQVLCQRLSHQDADVRKTVVFCLVEVILCQGATLKDLEAKFKLNPSQVKLVQIYVQRK